MNKKNKILLAIFIILSVLSIFFIYFQNKKNSGISTPTPKPINFELLKTIPASGSETPILPTSSIEFQFSKEIDIKSLILTTTPYEPFTFDTIDGGKTLLVRPTPAWEVKKNYQIKFTINSIEGETIPEVIYNFKIVPLTDSPLVD